MASAGRPQIGAREKLGLQNDLVCVPAVPVPAPPKPTKALEVLERLGIVPPGDCALIVDVAEDAPNAAFESAVDVILSMRNKSSRLSTS